MANQAKYIGYFKNDRTEGFGKFITKSNMIHIVENLLMSKRMVLVFIIIKMKQYILVIGKMT